MEATTTTTATVTGDQFMVEDLLDFSNDDIIDTSNSTSSDSSSVVAAFDTCNSSSSSATAAATASYDPHFGFSGDLCVPCEDLAQLEWLSNFVEESFSAEDLHKLHLISGVTSAFKSRSDDHSETHYYDPTPTQRESSPDAVFVPDMSVPGKARSKRSRTAPGNWASRLLPLSELILETPKPVKAAPKRKIGPVFGPGSDPTNGEVRRCLHCATDTTPQWRTGPMGPKTLCNACGVRYKSGRLVPEYRPAASPTFLLTKHSNSHRKVMELRRQKELHQHQQQFQQQQYQQLLDNPNSSVTSMLFDPPNCDDYLIHQHIGPDFRQLI